MIYDLIGVKRILAFSLRPTWFEVQSVSLDGLLSEVTIHQIWEWGHKHTHTPTTLKHTRVRVRPSVRWSRLCAVSSMHTNHTFSFSLYADKPSLCTSLKRCQQDEVITSVRVCTLHESGFSRMCHHWYHQHVVLSCFSGLLISTTHFARCAIG